MTKQFTPQAPFCTRSKGKKIGILTYHAIISCFIICYQCKYLVLIQLLQDAFVFKFPTYPLYQIKLIDTRRSRRTLTICYDASLLQFLSYLLSLFLLFQNYCNNTHCSINSNIHSHTSSYSSSSGCERFSFHHNIQVLLSYGEYQHNKHTHAHRHTPYC